MTIFLDETLLISKGSNRHLYRHPLRPDRAIKIVYSPPRQRRRLMLPWQWIVREDFNSRELRGYNQLVRMIPHRPKYFSEVYGLVSTNLTDGLEVENINPFNHPAFTLNQVKKRFNLPRDADVIDLLRQIDVLIDDVVTYGLNNHCFSPESIVFVRVNDRYEMRVVDYKVPEVSSLSPFSRRRLFGARNTARRLRAFRNRLQSSLQ